MKLFVDTNILMDVFAERVPFYTDASRIWTLAEQGRVDGLVSAVSFTTVYDLVDRWVNADSAREAVVLLRDALTAVACDAKVINHAIDAALPDFEDAVQYFCALHAGAECILTRNVRDFPGQPEIPVLSPREFLSETEIE